MPSIIQKIINYTRFPGVSSFPVIAELLKERKNAEAYLVGGAVRDILLGKKVTDFDIVIRGVPSEELGDFLASRGRVVFAGKRFGVWKFREVGKKLSHYDIALPRTEFSMHKLGIYKDFDVQTNPSLPVEEDLKRRDFTVNAMAYNLVTRELIDPHNGQKDLSQKIIRCVGRAQDRFKEDYSRLLRALRFALQLNFTISENTKQAIKTLIVNINNEIGGKRIVPYEIIAEEFLKSLLAGPVPALDMWDQSGALTEVAPELLKMKNCPQPDNWHAEGDVWNHTKLALNNLYSAKFKKEFKNEEPEIELIFAVLFHDVGKPYTIKTPTQDKTDRIRFDNHDQIGAQITKTILDKLKISAPSDISAQPERVAWLVRYHMLAVNGDPEEMKPTTIEKYFFNPEKPSKNLLKLILADGLATIGQDGQGLTNHYESLKKRIENIKKLSGSRGPVLRDPLVNGEDVMKILRLKPGPKIGKILEQMRRAQLDGKIKTKEEAAEYLQKLEYQA